MFTEGGFEMHYFYFYVVVLVLLLKQKIVSLHASHLVRCLKMQYFTKEVAQWLIVK